MSGRLSLRAALSAAPPAPDEAALLEGVRALRAAGRHRLVVWDDDPTGSQTVHGVPVLTRWDAGLLAETLARDWPAVYILTNSRSLPEAAAAALGREVGAALAAAARAAGVELLVVSRGDSTLRGHFPAEADALAEGLAIGGGSGAAGGGSGGGAARAGHGYLLVPAFFEGGRYTLGGYHYVADGDTLVPAGETEYARDPAFGYRSSYLPGWLAEKTGGRIAPAAVQVLELAELRREGPAAVVRRLAALSGGGACVADALGYGDVAVIAHGLWQAHLGGARVLCRTAASLVRALAGLPGRALLDAAEVIAPADPAGHAPPRAGLCVVGSYIDKSTRQLARLLELPGLAAIELSVAAVLDPARSAAEVQRAAASVGAALAAGQDTVLHTSRGLVRGPDAAGTLAVGQQVSAALSAVVSRLAVRPRFLIAKGGVTSHDLAVRALGVCQAMVLGQLLPGVPVWSLGHGGPFPGLPYVVFPGNVGTDDSLATAFARLRAAAH